MCGFIGRISEEPSREQVLLRALPYLARRGPDAQQLWTSSDSRVSLLHTRLSIVDKDLKANQPFRDIEKGITLVFVGEIYNYLELRESLPHYCFRTQSDTETILAVYAEQGIEGLYLLKGMFSLAIIDERQKKIILCRDHLGKKPLYLARWQNDILFGSSILALAAAAQANPLIKINPEVLAYYWENAFIPIHTSVLSGVTPVLPGQVLELDWQGNLVRQMPLETPKEYIYNGESPEEVNRLINLLLRAAVRRRLRHNPQPTVLLSGGIDSTLVCALAQNICQEEGLASLQAITLRSWVPLSQDEFYARFAARRIRTKLQLVNPAQGRLGDSIIQAFDLQDEPLGIFSFFLLVRLVKAASALGRILLSGDGGDEVFLGYGKPADWYDSVATQTTAGNKPTYGPEVSFWMSAWAKKSVTDVLVGHMLAKVDRASAEQAVEIRSPLLDCDLISYVRTLPFEILTYGGRTKALLKYQLQGWPKWFLERPKLGFAYHLRWHWGFSNYAGLREAIDPRAIDTFASYLSGSLEPNPRDWKRKDIFSNFEAVWRLLAWSRFLAHLQRACSVSI